MKLIVSDVDGTLIRGYREGIPAGLFPLVDRLFEKGIYFAVATGRQFENAEMIFAPVKEKIFFLCENGCKTVYQGKCIDLLPMDTGREQELMAEIERMPGCELWINTDRGGYLTDRNPEYIREMREEVEASFQVIHDPAKIQDRFTKIGLLQWHEEVVHADIAARFREKYGAYFQIVASGHGWLDFMAKDAGKGTALKRLQERLQVRPEETLVFGDNENDVSMFQCTPHAYAMDTSFEHVKKMASGVTGDVVKELTELTEGWF